MVIHTGEKPSQCILCDNDIAKPLVLYKHMMIHIGENPSQCILCVNEIATPLHLNKYIVFHTEEKNFPRYSM